MIVNAVKTGMDANPVETVVFVLLAAVMLLLSGKTMNSIQEEVREAVA